MRIFRLTSAQVQSFLHLGDDVLAEVRKREHYESPSVKRRKKSEAARKNKKKFY